MQSQMAGESDRKGRISLGRHLLIVPEYNFKVISEIITKFVERCSTESWPEVAMKLSQIGAWEFEDYQKS